MSRYIASQDELLNLVRDLEGSRVLALDTEFLREKTYYAKLCLIQLDNGSIQALIDPFSVEDLGVLAPILRDASCTKVFHAASQDIEILHHATGVVPTPVFDTQIAAAYLGHPLQVGYGPLVRSVCDVHLPKADGYTDWSHRPLSRDQLRYALDDVVYLPRIYETFERELRQQGRISWVQDDFEALCDPGRYTCDVREAWRRVKRISSLSRKQLAIVRELAAWRENKAMKRDVPRKWVLADEAIVEVARKAPHTRGRLLEVRGLAGKLSAHDVDELLAAVRAAEELPQERLPKLDSARHGEHAIEGAAKLMSALVEVRARQNDVAAQLLASHADLEKLAHGCRDDVAVLEGWRHDMVGRELVELLEGRIALCLGQDGLEVTERHRP